MTSFKQQSRIQLNSQATYLKGDFITSDLAEVNGICVVSTYIAAEILWSGLIFRVSLKVHPTNEWAISNKDSIITGGPTYFTRGTFLEHVVQVIKENAQWGPTGYLLHKASLAHLESQQIYLIHINIHKEKAKIRRQKHTLNERTGEIFRKKS